ncbi:MAG: PQQ-dependent sugar dehydrogenase [Planctomycetes bacterium]|nr:PQQ-dependent sugar dehydrogenase [Planctomycetota bacterium]MCB9910207.1 PQQ-dependent sugar dehydrogenase [Planctomycetota bacterium]
MNLSHSLALVLAVPLLSTCGFAQEATPVEPSIHLEPAFVGQTFEQPLFLTAAGDGSGRLFVIEHAGTIRVFDSKAPEKPSEVFLDIREKVSLQFNEEGLLGLAFHPNYKQNGTFFVHYSSSVEDKVGFLARYQVSKDNPNRADPESEVVLLRQPQPWRNHNGGMIAFGPDGFLYLSFGDGGAGGDPKRSGQNLGTWLGKILRLDVDHPGTDKPYGIPADNPFVKGPEGAMPEIYAFGLRNVWRFSFDRQTGDLWAGDVGQNTWEEVDLIHKGGNYGWNAWEGFVPFGKGNELSQGEHVLPIAAYGRKEGISVTGGYVYRGKRFPELAGSYFYGDFASGNIWRLQKQADGTWHNAIALERSGKSIASFSEDAEGELYLLDYAGGIYRLVPGAEPATKTE